MVVRTEIGQRATGWLLLTACAACSAEQDRAESPTIAGTGRVIYGRLMPRARMLAGGIVEPGAGRPGAVLAYVAVSGGRMGSRLFKVHGPADGPRVEELPPETTIDLSRFDRDTEHELRPALEEIERLGGIAAIAIPRPAWICGEVRDYLKEREGIDLD